ncbi:26S proteasome non-ATPase regulatory subunit 5 [Homalodisca vitripennis]|nr:26S proteasome non-ATPase regulatory subunit 5 [Homalodisca vitripennis]
MRPRGSRRNDCQLSQQCLECDRKRISEYSVSDQDTEMLAVVREWFNLLGSTDHVMTKVGDMAQQPFPEIKLAVLMLLQVLAEQPWSQQYIRNTPGILVSTTIIWNFISKTSNILADMESTIHT